MFWFFKKIFVCLSLFQEGQLEEYAKLLHAVKVKTAAEQQQLDAIVDSQQSARAGLDKVCAVLAGYVSRFTHNAVFLLAVRDGDGGAAGSTGAGNHRPVFNICFR